MHFQMVWLEATKNTSPSYTHQDHVQLLEKSHLRTPPHSSQLPRFPVPITLFWIPIYILLIVQHHCSSTLFVPALSVLQLSSIFTTRCQSNSP